MHAAGSTLLSQVQTVEAARRSAEVGVDVIIAQGNDAGGHAGEIPLLPLLPQVVDVAGTVPVLAAGGIGDGRGLSAVLMLGAQGAAMGTRFLASDEAESDWSRRPAQVLDASADDSVWTTTIDIAQGWGGRTDPVESAPGRSAHGGSIAGPDTRASSLSFWATIATPIMPKEAIRLPPTQALSPAWSPDTSQPATSSDRSSPKPPTPSKAAATCCTASPELPAGKIRDGGPARMRT